MNKLTVEGIGSVRNKIQACFENESGSMSADVIKIGEILKAFEQSIGFRLVYQANSISIYALRGKNK